MLKVDIKENKEHTGLNCQIMLGGSIADICYETAEMVRKIRESLEEQGDAAVITFSMAVSAAATGHQFSEIANDMLKDLKSDSGKEEEEADS